MSTFVCPIVQVGKIGRHPNADNLSISQIVKYPCIIKTGDFNEGDRAVYIPEEALVPNTPLFQFLWTKRVEQKDVDGNVISTRMIVEDNPPERHRVIWAKKLRGIFSMGLLIHVPENLKDLPLGTDVSVQLGIEKFEKPEPICGRGGNNESPPGWFRKYTEIEHLRKYDYVLDIGEEVTITEKIHGENARFCYHEDRLYIGSHYNTKTHDDTNPWWPLAVRLGLEEKLKAHPDIIIYGERYGQVQKGFNYGLKGDDLVVFDAFDIVANRYLNEIELKVLIQSLGLMSVPILYRGPWQGLEAHEALAEGPTFTEGKHIREGFVVKPVVERWHPEVGRVILKLVGQEFLLGKKGR